MNIVHVCNLIILTFDTPILYPTTDAVHTTCYSDVLHSLLNCNMVSYAMCYVWKIAHNLHVHVFSPTNTHLRYLTVLQKLEPEIRKYGGKAKRRADTGEAPLVSGI